MFFSGLNTTAALPLLIDVAAPGSGDRPARSPVDPSNVPGEMQREKDMTITEVLSKAVEGGYHIQRADDVATYYSGANENYSAWTRTDTDSTFMIPLAETFLDAEFWRSLGRALGWKISYAFIILALEGRGHFVDHMHDIGEWFYHWHRFIQHLAECKDVGSFFKDL
jgi:hypothetical protein